VLVVKLTLAGQRFLALNGGTGSVHARNLVSGRLRRSGGGRWLWDALSTGGSVERCGWLKDRYGVSWQIVPSTLPQLLGDPDPAGAARHAAILQMIKLDIAGLEAAAPAITVAMGGTGKWRSISRLAR
jgi:predicted 3-demethylubiquinone-9 3-methyltransferase (glyoxalase superfamily)